MISFESIFYEINNSDLIKPYLEDDKVNIKFLLKSLNLSKKELNRFMKLNLVKIRDIETNNTNELENELALRLLVVLDLLIKKVRITLDSNINPSKTIREAVLEGNNIFEVIEVLFGTLLASKL
jgi:hypothetical protein